MVNTNACKGISKEQAQEFMNEAILIFFKTMTDASKNYNNKRKIHATPVEEVEHNIRSLASDTRVPVAHGIPKFHKEKINPPP